MDGTPGRKLMTVEEAKARLLEFGRQKSADVPLSEQLVRAGGLLLGGAVLGRLFDRRSASRSASPLRDMLLQSVASATPIVIEHVLAALRAATPANQSTDADSAPVSPVTPPDACGQAP